jgi:hypothetical protein
MSCCLVTCCHVRSALLRRSLLTAGLPLLPDGHPAGWSWANALPRAAGLARVMASAEWPPLSGRGLRRLPACIRRGWNGPTGVDKRSLSKARETCPTFQRLRMGCSDVRCISILMHGVNWRKVTFLAPGFTHGYPKGLAISSYRHFNSLNSANAPTLGRAWCRSSGAIEPSWSPRGLEEELNGRSSWGMGFEVFEPLEGDREDVLAAWLDEFRAKTARRDFDRQADQFVKRTRQWIERSLDEAPSPPPRPWQPHFWRFLDRMLNDRCRANGFIYKPDRLRRHDCYQGSKLQLAVLYERYYLRRKKWADSDYLDLMHLLEMAYANVVVTERSVAAAMNQIRRSLPELSIPAAHNLSWLNGARLEWN